MILKINIIITAFASTRSHGGISPGRFQRQLSRDVGSWNYGSCSPFSLWLWSRVGVRCKIQSQWKSNRSPLGLCFCLNFQGWIKAPWGISRSRFCWVSADRTELRCVLHPTPLRMDMEKRTFFNAPVKYSEIPRVVLFKCSGFIYYLSPGFWRGTLSVLLRREERLWSSPLRAVCFSNKQSPRAGSGGGVLRGWVPCYLVHLVLL